MNAADLKQAQELVERRRSLRTFIGNLDREVSYNLNAEYLPERSSYRQQLFNMNYSRGHVIHTKITELLRMDARQRLAAIEIELHQRGITLGD
jgi:predicted HTH domain antitoxin